MCVQTYLSKLTGGRLALEVRSTMSCSVEVWEIVRSTTDDEPLVEPGVIDGDGINKYIQISFFQLMMGYFVLTDVV